MNPGPASSPPPPGPQPGPQPAPPPESPRSPAPIVPSEIVRGVVAARRSAGLFFDVDGVLAPIVGRPEEARVPEAVRAALGALVGGYGLVAVVSGRSVDDAARMVDLDGLVVVGDHGREVRAASGATRRAAPSDRRLLEEVAASLASDEALSRLGVRVELKRASVALHVRGAPDETRALEAAEAAAAASAAGPGLVHHRGRAVVDLKLPGADKGTAVTSLVKEHGLAAALYVGDDRTDVDAMEALRATSLSPLVLVGVLSTEMPAELVEAAHVLVPFQAVLPLLEALRPSRPE